DLVPPCSTSDFTRASASPKVLFCCCSAWISRHCTSGRPASIMVANWRVKTTRSRIVTPFRNSLRLARLLAAFGRTEIGAIIWPRSCIIAAASLLASIVPFLSVPWRVRPSQAKTGMPFPLVDTGVKSSDDAASGARHAPLHDRAAAALDQVLQLLHVVAARHRVVEADQPPLVERRERLVHGLHPVLVLADLHLRVDLMDLVLADQVADRGVRDHQLDREHAARAVRAREQRLAQHPLEHERELRPYLRLLVGREHVHDAVDGLD